MDIIDETWKYGLYGLKQPEFKRLLAQISSFLNDLSDLQTFESLSLEKRQTLLKLWSEFIAFQSSSKITPFLFKIALNKPKLQKYVLPIHRLDYLAWYIDNYLYHNEDYRQEIASLSCPTTFFSGEQSTLYPIEGQILIAQSVENSQQIIFKKSGHTLLMSKPIKFTKEIHQFLKADICLKL